MHRNRGRLVDDEQLVIFENDFQLELMRFRWIGSLCVPLERKENLYPIARLDEPVRLRSLAIQPDCILAK